MSRTIGPGRSGRGRPAVRAGWISLGVVALFLLSSNDLSFAAAPHAVPSSTQSAFDSHIHHIVFLMQENHAYDSLFGSYCLVTSKYCPSAADGLPYGTCVPKNPWNASQGCVKPYNFTRSQMTIPDMPHDWGSTHKAYNNGSMNDFYQAEGSRTETFGEYNGTTVPVYWDLAEQYALADNFFSSAASYSLPNHWYEVAPSAPNISYTLKTAVAGTPVKQLHTYLNEANATPTIEAELNHSKVSWAYYDFTLDAYNYSIRDSTQAEAYGYWNPLAAQAASYKVKERTHFDARSQFFSDAANGTLPNISWVIPTPQDSDHPSENLSNGESWVASVVDAIEASPEWNSTALFITWDEYGGFYDPVASPQLDAYGDGFRVPLLVISPWVGQGAIDASQMDFSSVLHLMETTFHLKCLGARDCNAALPLSLFSFGGKPRAPIYFAQWTNSTYPMALQSSGKLPPYDPLTLSPPPPPTFPANAPLPQNVDWS